jgi:hypothetical protein
LVSLTRAVPEPHAGFGCSTMTIFGDSSRRIQLRSAIHQSLMMNYLRSKFGRKKGIPWQIPYLLRPEIGLKTLSRSFKTAATGKIGTIISLQCHSQFRAGIRATLTVLEADGAVRPRQPTFAERAFQICSSSEALREAIMADGVDVIFQPFLIWIMKDQNAVQHLVQPEGILAAKEAVNHNR